MIFKRPKISDVFTPRRSEVNSNIYIARPNIEKEVRRSIEGSLHTLIFGNSGNGKSWLYKKVISDLNATCAIANCANAIRFDSITTEIVNTILPKGSKELETIEEEMSAEMSVVVAKSNLKSKRKYKIMSEDPLLSAYHVLRKKANGSLAVLVLDNMESIIDNAKHMEELANIIILCDDNRYSKYNVKILLVGVPSRILEYFSKVKNLPTVANRIQEITEVSNFTETQVNAFVEVGFVRLLGVNIPNAVLEEWKSHIYNVTLGIPQRLHEYCEALAYILEDNKWEATTELLQTADTNWCMQGLRESYCVIDSLMNDRETEIGRKNQVLYTMGKIKIHYFTSKHISDRLKKEFPNSTTGVTLAISKILTKLASIEPSIIKKSTKGNCYEFTDPRYLMTLRAMLIKEKNEKIIKRGFSIYQ